jgi:hypothetical protein
MGGGRWAHLRLFRACATPALYLAAEKLLLPVAGPGVRPGLRRIQTKSWIRGDHSELGGGLAFVFQRISWSMSVCLSLSFFLSFLHSPLSLVLCEEKPFVLPLHHPWD